MIKNLFFLIVSIFCTNHTFSQLNSSPSANVFPVIPKPVPTGSYRNQTYDTQFLLFDPTTGKKFINNYVDVEGSPFLTEDWKYSNIKLVNGKVFDRVKTRLDLYSGLLHFKSQIDEELVFDTGYVKEIDVYESIEIKKILYKFRTGFSKIDNQSTNTYYEVLTAGKITLLKLISKKMSVSKNDLSGEVQKKFIDYTDYYIYADNQINRLKKEKDFILKTLFDKMYQIEKFAEENHLSYKILKDIIVVINFYNSLHTN